MNKYTKDEVIESFVNSLTMKDLRKFVKDNPKIGDDVKVLCQRVNDSSFQEIDMGSGTYPLKGREVYLVEDNKSLTIALYKRALEEQRKIKGIVDNLEITIPDSLKEEFFISKSISKEEDDSLIYIYND